MTSNAVSVVVSGASDRMAGCVSKKNKKLLKGVLVKLKLAAGMDGKCYSALESMLVECSESDVKTYDTNSFAEEGG